MFSRPQRWLITCFSLVVAVALLEIILQGLSWIHHVQLTHDYEQQLEESLGTSAERRVLCVGDSFTFGMGASAYDQSYPAQLERMLNATPGSDRWKVLNFGKPGMNSWEVRRFLDEWIRLARPTYVCLLIGDNDSWNAAYAKAVSTDTGPNVVLPRSPARWAWKYRTGVLLGLLTHNLRQNFGNGPADTAQPIVVTQGRALDGQDPPPRSQDTTDDLWTLGEYFFHEAEDYRRAEAAFAQLLAEEPTHLDARIRWAQIAHKQHRVGEALETAASVWQELMGAEDTPPQTLHALATFYSQLGNRPTARQIAQQALREDPQRVDTILFLARLETDEGNFELAIPFVELALSLDPRNPLAYRERLFLQTRLRDDMEQAYRDAVTSYQLSHDEDASRDDIALLLLISAIGPEAFDQILLDNAATRADADVLRHRFAELHDRHQRNDTAQLQQNLEVIAAICRGHDLPLFFLGYPSLGTHEVTVVAKTVAARTSSPFIDVGGHLNSMVEQQGLPLDHFSSRDGHANDAGYRELAHLTADQLLRFHARR